MIEETISIRTNLKMIVWEDGIPIDYFETHNEWTTAGLNVLRDWLSGDFTDAAPSHIAWADPSDEQARDTITQRVTTTDKVLLIRQFLPSNSSANGYSLDTVLLYNAASGGTLFAFASIPSTAKTASNQITLEWTHTLA